MHLEAGRAKWGEAWKTVCSFLERSTCIQHVVQPPGPQIYPREMKTCDRRGPVCSNRVALIIIITAENWNRLKCPSACEQINKLWYILSFPIKRKQSTERRPQHG